MQRRLLREGTKALGQIRPPTADRRTAMLALQRSIGNRNMGRLMQGSLAVQHKLQVGPTDDRYEREADLVADDVMRRMADGPALDDDRDHARVSRLVQRRVDPAEATIGLEGGPVEPA
ncbi:MAG: hypothetical protein ACRDTE_13195 [Pseudonocardiaceae bacterium]